MPIARCHDFCVRAGVGSRPHTIEHVLYTLYTACRGDAKDISRVFDAGKGKRFPSRRKVPLQIILEFRAHEEAKRARLKGSTSEENGDVLAIILARFELFDERCCERGGCNENEGEEFHEHRGELNGMTGGIEVVNLQSSNG